MAEQKKTTNKSNTTSKTSANKNASNRSAANKNTGTKERSTRKTTTAMNQKRFGDSIVDEIIIILVIVVCIVAQLSLMTDSMGVIGGAISSLFKGLFGLGGVLVPISAIVYCIWLLVSKERKGAILRACGVVLFIWTIASFMQVVNPLYGGNLSFINRVAFYFGEGAIANGGLIGASSGGMLVSALGAFGAGLILFAVLIISIIMTTGKSLFYALGDLSARQKVKRKARNERVKIQAEEIRQMELLEEERLARRRENLVRKKNYNIQLRKGEGTKKVMEVQATNFRKKKEPSFQKAKPIFDFVIEEKAEKEVHVAPILKAVKPVTAPVVEPFVKRFVEPIVEQEEPIVVELQKRVKPDFAEDIFADADEAMAEAEFDDIPIILAKDSLPEIEEEAEIAVATEEFDETPETDEAPKAASAPTAKTPLEQVAMALAEPEEKPQEKPYQFPPISLLGVDPKTPTGDSKAEMMANARKLESTLKSFGVEAKVVQINSGPTVTRYELSPSQGVKVSKIVNLADDIALNLAASGIRIEAPIPGKAAVGIEVPNKETKSVYLRTVLESEAFLKHPSKVAFALGEDIAGNAVVTDIAKMPHMLIAGATGSGKSVCINTLITSILYKADPNEVKLLLVDPKVVELSVYNGIPHLLIPVVTDPKKASAALNWAVREMLNRYNDFAASGVRDIKGFNAMKEETGDLKGKMSQIVIVIDELADLMMAAAGEVEDSICRLAQMARAAGMHLIIATQRPSVDVITGVIKANIPSRLAFAVSSGIDSRTILDMVGAEKLLGKGDMLFYPTGQSKPARLQGAFVTDKEVEEIVTFLKKTGRPDYTQETINQITAVQKTAAGTDEDSDEFYEDAVDLIIEKEKASVSMLQRQFRIGYNRAARLVDELERNGVVGPEDGSKPRKVLITRSEWEEMNAPVEEEIP